MEESIRQREKGKIYNPDGTEMRYEDYMMMLKTMNQTGDPAKIANFGWSQTAIHQLNVEEKKLEKAKQKDYLKDVINAKRLLPWYAKQEREEFENRLKEKGLWTMA